MAFEQLMADSMAKKGKEEKKKEDKKHHHHHHAEKTETKKAEASA